MSNATGVFNMSSDDVVESNDLHIDMTTPKGEYIYADRNITKIIVEIVTMSIMWTFSLIINILVCVVIYIAAEDCDQLQTILWFHWQLEIFVSRCFVYHS